MHYLLTGFLLFGATFAQADSSCLRPAVKLLKQTSAAGFAAYQKANDPNGFGFWLECNDATYGLGSAVHETVHEISSQLATGDAYRYYLPEGDVVTVARQRFFFRNEVASLLTPEERNTYYKTYLTGTSGQQDFLLLLDEFNAYAHGVLVIARLNALIPEGYSTSDRDGLANFMYYTELYLRQARLKHPDAWQALARADDYLNLLQRLWTSAEKAMTAACAFPRLGLNDGPFLRKIYLSENLAELSALFAVSKKSFIMNPPPSTCGRFAAPARAEALPSNTTVHLRIKVDGHELSPAEIEQYLKRHPELR